MDNFILFFQTSFLHIKCAPFFLNIGNNYNSNIVFRKELKLVKFMFITHFGSFGSNVFLTLKFIKFENVS